MRGARRVTYAASCPGSSASKDSRRVWKERNALVHDSRRQHVDPEMFSNLDRWTAEFIRASLAGEWDDLMAAPLATELSNSRLLEHWAF